MWALPALLPSLSNNGTIFVIKFEKHTLKKYE